MLVPKDDAMQVLKKWETEGALIFCRLTTTIIGGRSVEIKQTNGIEGMFQGQIATAPLSISFRLPNNATILLHIKEAEFEYGDYRESSPMMQIIMNNGFEHFLHIRGGYLWVNGEKKWPTWEATLIEPSKG